ncbi:MAG: radical SAM protein [Anaerocolumna sp.]
MILKERYDANFNGKLLLKKSEEGRVYTSVKITSKTNKDVVFFDLPIIAHISATQKCNLNCNYCYAKDNNKKEDMVYEEFKTVLDKCNDNGVMIIYWSGGEPFVNNPD